MLTSSSRFRAPYAFFHPSNLLTYASVTFAWAAVIQAMGGGVDSVVGGCLIVSSVCDMLDGRFARFSERWFPRDASHRSFGVQIDSLADAVSFGLVPVVLVLMRASPSPFSTALTLLSLIYLLCVLTRLGQFNVAVLERWEGASYRFIGLPTTYVGLIWGLWFAFSAPGPSTSREQLILGALSFLMVAPIPIPRPRGAAFVVLIAASLGLAAAFLWLGVLA